MLVHATSGNSTKMSLSLQIPSFYIKKASFLYLLVMFVQVFSSHLSFVFATRRNETDRLALLDIKSKFLHDPQGRLSSWNHSSHFCQWEGVVCSRRRRRVTVLDLRYWDLGGSLSPSIGNLSFLKVLYLFNNGLEGEIPFEIGRLFRLQRLNLNNNSFGGEIPANLSHCFNLEILALANNKLVGKIPREIFSLSKVWGLEIYSNYLTGGIPSYIANLTSLESIDVSFNNLGGRIPDAIGELKKLSVLVLGFSNLSGMIPPSIYNLSLTVLELGGNQIGGFLPPLIGEMLPHLQFLDLSYNHFTGSLPLSFSNCSNLHVFQVATNSFVGKIAINFGNLNNLRHLKLFYNNLGSGEHDEMNFIASMANCSNLETLDLGQNQLRGVLPNSIGNLSIQLSILGLGFNFFHGNFPIGITNLLGLTWLSLHSSELTGEIPTGIGSLQNLQRLDLSHNSLTGKIPDSIGNLSFLSELYLGNNSLTGNIPVNLGNCHRLSLLSLSGNNLSGSIPKELFGLSLLSITLRLDRNHFSGTLPLEIGNLASLRELDVGVNDLSGDIPTTLGRCTSLENLFMQENFFRGSIPSSLSSMRGLVIVDLSYNNLSGHIPTFFEHFLMMYLILSFNNFEGEVPMNGVFSNSSAISVVGNSRLCGGIPELQLPRCPAKEPKKRQKRSIALVIVISTVCALLGAFLVVLSFLFCRNKRRRKSQEPETGSKDLFMQVSYQRLLKATNGFSSENLIDVGGFGSIYKGILDEDNATPIAVKVLNLQRRGASKSFMAECAALRNIRHRNLLKIITACSSVDYEGNEFKALVYEFMPNGSLERWLHPCNLQHNNHNEHSRLSLLQRLNIAIDVANALDYLHHQCEAPILHCDLKPSNILLDADMVAHVGDFGLARVLLPPLLDANQSSSIGVRGTVGYAAPEYGLGSEASTSGDVYSFGIFLLEMITGKRPTDPMFQEGHNLHEYARMALPDQVMEILEPFLLRNDEDEITSAVATTNNSHIPRREECLISLVKIGVSCSMVSTYERISINEAIRQLLLIKGMV